MHVAAFIILVLAAGSVTAADQARTVPDPYGLGERLALIDYLHAHHVVVPEGAHIEQLRAMYGAIVGAPATFSTTEEELKASAAHEEERRQTYRAKLMRDYAPIQIPETATIGEMTAIERVEAEKKAKADKEAAEKAYAAEREAKEAAERRAGITPGPQGGLPVHDDHGGVLVRFLLVREFPQGSDFGSLGQFVYELHHLNGEGVREDGAILVTDDVFTSKPGVMQRYLVEVQRVEVTLQNGFTAKRPVYRLSGEKPAATRP